MLFRKKYYINSKKKKVFMNSYSDSFPQKDLRSLRETPINQEVGFCLWMGALFPFFLKARADRLRVGGVDTKLLGKVFIVMC